VKDTVVCCLLSVVCCFLGTRRCIARRGHVDGDERGSPDGGAISLLHTKMPNQLPFLCSRSHATFLHFVVLFCRQKISRHQDIVCWINSLPFGSCLLVSRLAVAPHSLPRRSLCQPVTCFLCCLRIDQCNSPTVRRDILGYFRVSTKRPSLTPPLFPARLSLHHSIPNIHQKQGSVHSIQPDATFQRVFGKSVWSQHFSPFGAFGSIGAGCVSF
jgi:hypothetical protein